ncbi:MAG: DUF2079 domain-containing protein [Thermoactinospora sp.]|nr:DUF2079 domain-containing protein [Thermoactinospora sp.]
MKAPTARARRDTVLLTAMTVAAAALYSALSLLRLANFQASAYDLVIFDQAVRSYSRFGLPVAIVKGVHNDFGPAFSVLGDHFSPILALLAPLYWVADTPVTLLVAQAVLMALAAVPLWVFTRRAMGVAAAHLVAAAYLLSWPVVEAVAFDFHEVAFAPPATAVMLERWQAGRKVHVVLAALALLAVKEDMGLLVAGFGLTLLTQRGWRSLGGAHVAGAAPQARQRGWRVMGGCFLAGGLGFTWLASQVLIPAFGGRPDYYWAYGALGSTMTEAATTALTQPLTALAQLGTPPVKLVTLGLLLGMTLLTACLSPVLLAALPLLAERMLASAFPNWWVPEYHYNAFLVMVVFFAGVDGACRLRAVRRAWPIAVLVVAVVSVPFFSLATLADPATYQRDERERAAAEAVAAVPGGVRVEAPNNLAPALSAGHEVLLWDRTPRWAPWVIADTRRRVFPFKDVGEQQARVRFLLDHGYRVTFERAGFTVLAGSGPAPS